MLVQLGSVLVETLAIAYLRSWLGPDGVDGVVGLDGVEIVFRDGERLRMSVPGGLDGVPAIIREAKLEAKFEEMNITREKEDVRKSKIGLDRADLSASVLRSLGELGPGGSNTLAGRLRSNAGSVREVCADLQAAGKITRDSLQRWEVAG